MIAIYWAQFKNTLAVFSQYRIGSIIGLLEYFVEPVVLIVVWSRVAAAQGGQVADYTPTDIALYYVIFIFVRQMVAAPPPTMFARRIREGTVSGLLLRPIHPIHTDIAEGVGSRAVAFVFLVPMLLVLMITFGIPFRPTIGACLAFLAALVLGGSLRFLIQWTISIGAFWTTEVVSIWRVYFLLQTFLGGALAPIALLPMSLQSVASLLPFRWIFAFPIELLLGRLSTREIVAGFVAQGLWFVTSLGLMQVLWRAGLRRNSAVGG